MNGYTTSTIGALAWLTLMVSTPTMAAPTTPNIGLGQATQQNLCKGTFLKNDIYLPCNINLGYQIKVCRDDSFPPTAAGGSTFLPCADQHTADRLSACVMTTAKSPYIKTCPNPQPYNFVCNVSTESGLPSLEANEYIKREDALLNGIQADRYVWRDSQGLVRSVAIKKQCAANTGNGGYAIQATFPSSDNPAETVTLTTNDTRDGGFGYFVAHERARKISNTGTSRTVAAMNGEDDSPLSRQFAISSQVGQVKPSIATHTTQVLYPKWGSLNPVDANDATIFPTSTALHRKYMVPVTTRWSFQVGRDMPNIQLSMDLSVVGEPDHINFDVRGPYGVLYEANNPSDPIHSMFWADSSRFTATSAQWSSAWNWNTAYTGGRYAGFKTASGVEMALYEPVPLAYSATTNPYTDKRGSSSASKRCSTQQLLPCNWEWPYQLFQYELPSSGYGTVKKLAWGSSAYYGSSLTSVWDGASSRPINSWPADQKMKYSVCWVLGKQAVGSRTHGIAVGASRATQCATPSL